MAISVSEIPLATITGEMITQIAEDLSSSHVISGLACSDGGGTTLAIAPGTARIGGYRAVSDATVSQVLTDDSVNYIYFSLTTDAQARVNGAEFTDYVTTQTENMKLIVSEVTCSGGSISTIIDQRVYLPITSLDIRNIPSQNADIITSGTLATARIPDLDASKIATGTLADARIPNVDILSYASTFATAQIPDLSASKIASGELDLARIPATLTGKDADTVDSKEPGTTSGKIAYYDGSTRIVDSNKLEGSTKSQVQDHTPKVHESSHVSGGSDEIDSPLNLAAIPALHELTKNQVSLDNTDSATYVTLATTTVSYSEPRTDLFLWSGCLYNAAENAGGEVVLKILPAAGYKETALGDSCLTTVVFTLNIMHATTMAVGTHTYALLWRANFGGRVYLNQSSDMIINSWKT